MATFTIAVSLDVSEPFTFHDDRERTFTIPPDYEIDDRRRYYAVRMETLVTDFFEDRGWLAPLRHTTLANAARLSRIEELIEGNGSPLADNIREVIETGSQEAIDNWGDPPIEE